MGFGVVSLLNAVFRRAFTSAGLRPSSVAVDADTTLHFWAHPSLLSSPDAESKQQQQQRGRRPVVVLIHGFGPDPTWQWAAQVGPLSRHFDLIVPTLLFFGASTTRAPDRSDAFQAAAIAKLLSGGAVGGEEEGRVVHVVGTSYGGLVAYHLARALQQGGGAGAGAWTVGKVAVCSSDLAKGAEDDRALAAKGGVADVTELMVPADTKALRRLMAICAHGPPKYLPECLARDLLRKCFTVQREGKIELIKGIASGHGFEITPLPQEVLIVWGEFDQIFPVAKAHKVKEKLGEKATVRIIPNTGHLPHQEDSKLFNKILLDFLLPPSSSSNGSAAAK